MNNLNGFDNNVNDIVRNGELSKGNRLKQMELKEQQAMRKAYCLANDIPYEEIEEIPPIGQGSLKVLVIVIWLFIVGVLISCLLTENNFLKTFWELLF